MLLILELALAVAAWRRGWDAPALLPLAITNVAALLIGVVVSLAQGSFNGIWPLLLLSDITCTIALIWLVIRPPRHTAFTHRPSKDGTHEALAGNTVEAPTT